MQSGLIEFPVNGRKGKAYLSVPSASKGAGLIVLQEWWGLVDHIKDVCERFSKEGFVAMAPDLYQGACAEGPDDAGRLMMSLKIEDTAKELASAAHFLAEHEAVTSKKVGALGFCMGGQLALLGASVSDQIGAVVDFYGIHPNVKLNFEKIKAPVLGIFAKRDEFVPLEKAKELEKALKAHNSQVDFHFFDADHAFFNDSRPEVYSADSAKQAWELSLKHLRSHL
ncbi:MAG: dienelactone hydrolase family protein [Bradymonadales bacterium]|nr:MAG: dienelactone hydrolase family protein [Bradymonadales bacterium]